MKKLILTLLFGFIVFNAFIINSWAQETIDFEGLAAGTIVSTVLGDGGSTVGVFGFNPTFGFGTNAAMIFDSNNPTGGDVDLGTPNETCIPPGPGIGVAGQIGMPFENCIPLNNLLIISEDLDSSDPDDADVVGAEFEFDFSGVGSGSATIHSIDLIDVEADEPVATVELLDGVGGLLAQFNLAQTGNNGVAVKGLGPTPGVVTMVVTLNGSGAIDNIVFTPDDGNGGEGCTPGGWQGGHLASRWDEENDTDWNPSGGNPFDHDTLFNDFFTPWASLDGLSMYDLVRRGGGPDAARKAARSLVAAYLNASHNDVDYPLTTVQLSAAWNAAVANGTFLDLHRQLDEINNLGCEIP